MPSSGQYLFSVTLASAIDEAFERCGIDPSGLSGRHIASARRSMNLMNASWQNEGVHLWKTALDEFTTVEGQDEYTLPEGTIDVLDVAIRRNGVDTPLESMSRDYYLNLHDKALTGRPDRFFVHRRKTPVMILWQVPDRDTDVIVFWRYVRFEDAGDLTEEPDIPYRWSEAYTSGLAARLAVKYAPARISTLTKLARAEFTMASHEDHERAPVVITPGSRHGRGYR